MAEMFFCALDLVYAVPYSFAKIVETEPMTWNTSVQRILWSEYRLSYVVDVSIRKKSRTTSHRRPNPLPSRLWNFRKRIDILDISAFRLSDRLLATKHLGDQIAGRRAVEFDFSNLPLREKRKRKDGGLLRWLCMSKVDQELCPKGSKLG
jgi:hypothetical protein